MCNQLLSISITLFDNWSISSQLSPRACRSRFSRSIVRELASKFIFCAGKSLLAGGVPPSFRCIPRVPFPISSGLQTEARARGTALRLPKTRDSVSSSDKRTRRASAFSIRLASAPAIYGITRAFPRAEPLLRPKIINEIEAGNNKVSFHEMKPPISSGKGCGILRKIFVTKFLEYRDTQYSECVQKCNVIFKMEF